MAAFTFRVRGFRVLENLEWSPGGVCVLSGANGAGKSTTLAALRFLRALFFFGQEAAFRSVDGVAFQRFGADIDAPVEFEVEVGDLTWQLRFPMSAQGAKGTYGEELRRAGKVELRAVMFEDNWSLDGGLQPRDEQRCCAKVLFDRGIAVWMQPLRDELDGIRVYDTYWLNQVTKVEPVSATDLYLHHTGRNLWSVLANWKGSPLRYGGQFDWVLAEARRAFPDLIGSIEFDRGLPYLYKPDASDPSEGLLPNRAADGLLTGLLHLTAVAGAKSGSLIAFDEVENQLHPHAIRSLIAAMRQQAEERDLTIVLTTHSPVVLNEFKGEEDRVFVLERGREKLPVPLDQLHSEAWLSHFALGDLYEREHFAAPRSRHQGG